MVQTPDSTLQHTLTSPALTWLEFLVWYLFSYREEEGEVGRLLANSFSVSDNILKNIWSEFGQSIKSQHWVTPERKVENICCLEGGSSDSPGVSYWYSQCSQHTAQLPPASRASTRQERLLTVLCTLCVYSQCNAMYADLRISTLLHCINKWFWFLVQTLTH